MVLLVLTLIIFYIYGLILQITLSECIACFFIVANYLILNDDALEFYFSNFNNSIINHYLAFFSKILICCFFGFFFLIVSNFLKEQNLISFEKFVSFMLAFLGLSYGYLMFGFSAVIFYSLLLIRIILFLRIWYNVISNMIFWLCQFKIDIKPKTFIIFVPLILFCIFEDTANFSYCMDGQQRPVFPEPNLTPEYLNLPYLQLEAFCQERISLNNALRQEENQLEQQVMLLTQARENNQQVDSIDEMEKIRRLETIKIKRLQVIEDQICFEHAKSYKLEQMERVSR